MSTKKTPNNRPNSHIDTALYKKLKGRLLWSLLVPESYTKPVDIHGIVAKMSTKQACQMLVDLVAEKEIITKMRAKDRMFTFDIQTTERNRKVFIKPRLLVEVVNTSVKIVELKDDNAVQQSGEGRTGVLFRIRRCIEKRFCCSIQSENAD